MHFDSKTASTLVSQKRTIAIAESCTGGLLSNTLTNISGASAFFWLGVIAYDNKAKTKILKIPSSVIKKHGAVSLPVAKLMAHNVRKILNTDFGIGITGIAGPLGGTPTKPVGLVYIALATRQKTTVEEFRFKGSRSSIKQQAAQKALELLLNVCGRL